MLHEILFRNNKWNWLAVLVLCIIALSVIIFLGIKSNNDIHDIVQQQYTNKQLLLSKQVSAGIEEFLNEKTINIEILAKDISDENPDKIMAEFKNVYNESAGIFVIEFINEKGVVSLGYPENNTPIGYNLYENNQAGTLERVKKRRDTFITKPLPLFEGELGAFIWTPVFNGDQFKGTVLAIIRISEVSNRFLKNYGAADEIFMIDKSGAILFDGSGRYPVGENYSDIVKGTNPLLEKIIVEQMNGTQGTGYYLEGNDSSKKLVAYSPVMWHNRMWSVALVSPASEVDALITSVYIQQAMFVGITGGLILLGSFSVIMLLSRWNKYLEQEVARTTGELKQSNELLRNANTKLRELDKLKSDFVSMVSHELKTPLTAMKTSSEFLLQDDPDTATRKDMLTLIIKNVERLTRMVNDLLDISRIESGRIKYEKEMVNLHDIVSSAITVIEKQSDEKDLTIICNIPEDLLKINVDKDRFMQVFVNLLSNAIKFTHMGGNIEICARNYENNIEIRVRDDGIGIPADKLEKIFEKFYQIDNTSTRNYGGTGMGLAITKGIVEAHSGTIWVESTPGSGSTFIILLPCER